MAEFLRSVGGYSIYKPGREDVVAAIQVSRWTKNAGTMLPKSAHEILDLFKRGDSVIVKNTETKRLVAHAAATTTYSDGSVEIGSIYTQQSERGRGVGTIATKAAIDLQKEKNPEATLFALANEQSGPMFTKMGGEKMSTAELSGEVWEFCDTCPRKPEQTSDVFMCCDTPYNLSCVKK